MFSTKLELSSGQTIQFPPRLLEHLGKESVWNINPVLLPQTTIKEASDLSPIHSITTATSALQEARSAMQRNSADEALLYLLVFGEKRSQRLNSGGSPEEGLKLLAEIIRLSHQALAEFHPQLVPLLIRQIDRQTEEAIDISTNFGSIISLIEGLKDVHDILAIAITIWDPFLEPWIRKFISILPAIATISEEIGLKQRQNISELIRNLIQLKKHIDEVIVDLPPPIGTKLNILRNLAEMWIQMVQQELLLIATAEYSATGLDLDIVKQQVQELLAEVEKRLRLTISEKYMEQFGKSWLNHVKAKHKGMYHRWEINQQRDMSYFKVYGKEESHLLDYSGFNDLRELISAQWHLFNNIFDFGYSKRNKSVFDDKTTHIIKIRNPLAHHRDIPENELLRAKVLCTDILLALDQAGAGLEQ